jgi:dUTPase
LFQAIITKYYVVDDDESIGVRNGGFGSTGM